MQAVQSAVVLLLDGGGWCPLGKGAWALPLGAEEPSIIATLRWLERLGGTEVHIVASADAAEQLEVCLRECSGTSSCTLNVNILVSPESHTEGEALRFLEQKDIVKGDFLLVCGPVVSNADLRPALQAHAARRAGHRQALMTTLLYQAPLPQHITATGSDQCLLVTDTECQQLLKLEQGSSGGHAAGLGTHILGEHNVVTIRARMQLCHVYICTLDALLLLSDNFDYQSIAGDLIPGVLSEQELGGSLHTYELARGYSKRIEDGSSYHVILEDVLGRWAVPWAPDNSSNQLHACRFNRGSYMSATATVAPSCHVSKGSILGRGSCVGANAVLDHTVVGSSCHLGSNTTMRGSCLLKDVEVGDDCVASYALLADHVLVRDQVQLETGVTLAENTVVDASRCVPAGLCVSLREPPGAHCSDSEEDVEATNSGRQVQLARSCAAAAAVASGGIPEASIGFHEDVVGQFGAGYAWRGQEQPCAWSLLSASTPRPEESCADSAVFDFARDATHPDDVGFEDLLQQTSDHFKIEVAETFLRCIKEGISHDNAVIELNGLKIAEDRTFADCARYIFTTVLSLCLPQSLSVKTEFAALFPARSNHAPGREGGRELLRRLNVRLRDWKELLRRFLKSTDDQVELLLTFEEYCAQEGEFSKDHGGDFADIFPQVLKLCYDHDIVTEDAILGWAGEKEHASLEDRHFVDQCSALLTWLQEASEEDSSDGDH